MVRSLDAQQILLQSNAVERVQQVQQHHGNVQQRHFEAQLAQEKRELKETVKDLEELGRMVIGEKEEQGEGKKDSREDKSKKEKENADSGELSAGESQVKIDIRV